MSAQTDSQTQQTGKFIPINRRCFFQVQQPSDGWSRRIWWTRRSTQEIIILFLATRNLWANYCCAGGTDFGIQAIRMGNCLLIDGNDFEMQFQREKDRDNTIQFKFYWLLFQFPSKIGVSDEAFFLVKFSPIKEGGFWFIMEPTSVTATNEYKTSLIEDLSLNE